ncbi:MAG TPA: response regulator transcription factor [Nitrospirae bacterium]|nr:transcriptional regulatory protein YycF [bacterium BMS3Abin06]HDH11918.1 response regulator transcription factor [Nitrospirota bacterium]HDZ02219.1 response regulator transcription factor [Nitrospirota bacterium]
MSNNILAVDDDRDILKVLKANLELHDYEVDTADCWAAAQKIMSIRPPDLILLDVMLPDGDGMEICRDLRKVLPEIPIIMLTAKDKVSDKVIGLESGADDYVVKPFETLELLARIKACLRRACPSAAKEKVAAGNIRVDHKKHIVTVSGKKVDLTPREFELLCFFINHRGEALSRETIRKNIWRDSNIYSWSRVIDVHIQHLRQKIEKDPSNPKYVLTVPGAGYRFMD